MPPPEVWYVVVHGGKKYGNNILSFDLKGNPVTERVLDTTSVSLRELRGFVVLADHDLYVANAHKGDGAIFRFGPPPASGAVPRPFLGVFTWNDPTANPGLLHPFSITTGPDGNFYVANQGSSEHKKKTNEVTRYYGPDSPFPGEPMPIPAYWKKHAKDTLFPGTVIPSSKKARHGLQRVRGVAFGPDGNLYLADELRNEVRRYDGQTFKYIDHPISGDNSDLHTPVHLLVGPDQKHLYIGSEKNNAVLRFHFSSETIHTFVEPGSGGLDAPAGMAFDDRWFYVCSRKGHQVLRYRLKDGSPDAHPFIHRHEFPSGSSYNLEFIVKVALPVRVAVGPALYRTASGEEYTK